MGLLDVMERAVPKESQDDYASLVTPQLLDSVRQKESSGGKDVGPNPKSGAAGPYQHIPTTVKMLSQKYGDYDPYNEEQSRERTKQYLIDLVAKNKGDVRAALKNYGGWITKDGTSYVNDIMSGAEGSSDRLINLMEKVASTPKSEQPKGVTEEQMRQPSKAAQLAKTVMTQGVMSPSTLIQAATLPGKMATEKLTGETTGSAEPSIKDIAKSAAGMLDVTAGGIIPAIAGGVTYAGSRFIGKTPEEASRLQQQVVGATDKPFGKAFGITEEPAYKQEATTRFMEFVGENMEKGADWISQKTGVPKEDVLSVMNTLSVAAPSVAGKVGGAVKAKVAPKFEQWSQEFNQARQPSGVFPEANVPQQAQPTVVQPGQPPRPTNVVEGFEIPQENPPMPQQPLSSGDVAARAEALRKVGIETARKSALENNPKEASSQYITSKASQEPYGQGMTAQINQEKSALDKHFATIEQDAGGTTIRYGKPEEVSDRIAAGQKVKEGLENGQKGWKKEGDRLYKEAEDSHGSKPIETNNFNEFLNEDSNFAYENEAGLQRGIKGYLKKKGLIDEQGNVKPMTVADAEGVRQYINSKFNVETKNLSRQLKANIDEDVFGSIGGETYEKARRHWQKGVETYDNPKGVGDLLSDEGVNQKIADENVINKVSALNQSQFDHLVNTLRQDKQETALKQIQTSLVAQIRRAGESAVNEPWNSVRAAKEAASLGSKLKTAFADNPKLLEKVLDGINAGNVIHIPTSYPGAAVQSHLLKSKFSEMALQKASTIAGGSVGSIFGPVGAGAGAAGGEVMGTRLSGMLRGKRQAKQVTKELTPLSEIGKR